MEAVLRKSKRVVVRSVEDAIAVLGCDCGAGSARDVNGFSEAVCRK